MERPERVCWAFSLECRTEQSTGCRLTASQPNLCQLEPGFAGQGELPFVRGDKSYSKDRPTLFGLSTSARTTNEQWPLFYSRAFA